MACYLDRSCLCSAEVFLDQPHQLLGRERLDEVLVRAELKPFLTIAVAPLGRDDDERGVAILRRFLEKSDQLEPVDVRHIDVGDDEVESLAGQNLERLEPRRGARDFTFAL